MRSFKKQNLFVIIPLIIIFYGYYNISTILQTSLVKVFFSTLNIVTLLIFTTIITIFLVVIKKFNVKKALLIGLGLSLNMIGFIGLGRKLLFVAVILIALLFILNKFSIKQILSTFKTINKKR